MRPRFSLGKIFHNALLHTLFLNYVAFALFFKKIEAYSNKKIKPILGKKNMVMEAT